MDRVHAIVEVVKSLHAHETRIRLKRSAQYPEFVEETSDVPQWIGTNEWNILLGDFNTYVVNDAGVRNWVIGKHVNDVNYWRRLHLQIRCNNALCIMTVSPNTEICTSTPARMLWGGNT